MSNREHRITNDSVHIYLALARPCHGEKADCIRTIDKGKGDELEILKAKLKVIGGNWRIHKTVNARDCQKAMKWLMKDLIDHPEHSSFIDSQWRTGLLQPECKVTNNFMLDVDTKEIWWLEDIGKAINQANGKVIKQIESPKGWHFICEPFDTREVCKIPNVTLIRDGYYYVCSIQEEK